MISRLNCKFLIATVALLLTTFGWAMPAGIVYTPVQLGANSVSRALEAYLSEHDGILPAGIEDLADYVNLASLERQIGGKLVERFLDLQPLETERRFIFALTRDVIIEDRRESPGRYVIWVDLDADGRYRSKVSVKWEAEGEVARYSRERKLELPSSTSFRQPDVLPHITAGGIQARDKGQLDVRPGGKGGADDPASNLPGKPVLDVSKADFDRSHSGSMEYLKTWSHGSWRWIVALGVVLLAGIWIFFRRPRA